MEINPTIYKEKLITINFSFYLDYLVINFSLYIYSSTDRSVFFNQNSSVWLDILASRSWDRNPVNPNASNPQPRGTSSNEVNFKRLWITITIVYIHPFNGYRDLNSYMKRLAINANGNTITSFTRELNPMRVREYIYLYSIYIYIYIYICVCGWGVLYKESGNTYKKMRKGLWISSANAFRHGLFKIRNYKNFR